MLLTWIEDVDEWLIHSSIQGGVSKPNVKNVAKLELPAGVGWGGFDNYCVHVPENIHPTPPSLSPAEGICSQRPKSFKEQSEAKLEFPDG